MWWDFLPVVDEAIAETGNKLLTSIANQIYGSLRWTADATGKVLVGWLVARAWKHAQSWAKHHSPGDSKLSGLAEKLSNIIKTISTDDSTLDSLERLENIIKQIWDDGLVPLNYTLRDLESWLSEDFEESVSEIKAEFCTLKDYLNLENSRVIGELESQMGNLDSKICSEINKIISIINLEMQPQLTIVIGKQDRLLENQERMFAELSEIKKKSEHVSTLPYEAVPEPQEVGDLMQWKHVVSRLPTDIKKLTEEFYLIGDDERCKIIEICTQVAIALGDVRLKVLIELYELYCNGRSLLFQGHLSLNQGKKKEAIQHIKTWLENQGQNEYNAYNNLAVLIAQTTGGDLQEVLELLTKADRLKPKNHIVLRNKARCLMDYWMLNHEEDYWKQSLCDFKKSIKANPKYALAYLGIGALYALKGNNKDAQVYLERAFNYEPDNLKVLSNLGLVLKQRYDKEGIPEFLEKASLYLERSIRIKPDYYMGWGDLGDVFLAKRKLTEAENAYQRSLSKQDVPFYRARMLSNLGIIYEMQGRIEEAIQTQEEAIRELPSYTDAWYNLGVLLQNENRIDEALKSYRKVLKYKSTHTSAIYNRGMILEQKGQTQKAIEAYKSCITLDSGHFKARARLGRILSAQGNYDDAEKWLQDALSLNPEDSELWAEIGLLMDRTQKQTIDLRGIGLDVVQVESVKERSKEISENSMWTPSGTIVAKWSEDIVVLRIKDDISTNKKRQVGAPPEILSDFAILYSSRTSLKMDLENIERSIRSEEIAERECILREKDLKKQIEENDAKLAIVKEELIRYGPRYRDIIDQLEHQEALIEGAKKGIRQLLLRKKKLRISRAAFEEAWQEYLKSVKKTISTTDRILHLIREEAGDV